MIREFRPKSVSPSQSSNGNSTVGLRPLREIQHVHGKHKIEDSEFVETIAPRWMQWVLAPLICRITKVEHITIDARRRGLGAEHVDIDIDCIVVDELGIAENAL